MADKLNINEVDKKQLMEKVADLDDVTAQRIVDNQPYTSEEELEAMFEPGDERLEAVKREFEIPETEVVAQM